MIRTSAHKAFKQKVDPRYTLERAVEAGEAATNVPQCFEDVLDEMAAGVRDALAGPGDRLLVECLPPGLNPDLEATVPYNPSRELAVVRALLRSLPAVDVRVACPSAGDAAMAARAFEGAEGLERCSFCGLSGAPGAGKDPAGVVKRVFGKAPAPPEIILILRPRNSVGDPVIEDVMTVAEAAEGTGARVVLLNPDLSEKVALGIHAKDRWARFVSSFAPAFHFSNFCSFERPSCRHIERGVVLFSPARGWELFHAIPQLTSVTGDLRRYGGMQSAEGAPVPFLLAAAEAARPSKDDVTAHMKHGQTLAKVLRSAA